MKNKILLILAICLTFFFQNVFSQSVDEVLSKYYEATGGKEKIKAVKSVKYTGYSNIMNMDIPFTQYVKRPDKWLLEIFVQGSKILQCYNGSKGWMVNPMTGSKKATETDEETTKQFKENTLIGGRLYNIDEMGYKVELAGKEELNGKGVYHIKLTDKDGENMDFYLDAETYLITKTVKKSKRMGKELITENYFSNYKKLNDMTVAYTMEQKVEGSEFESQTVSIDKIEVNIEIDDKIFEMPKE